MSHVIGMSNVRGSTADYVHRIWNFSRAQGPACVTYRPLAAFLRHASRDEDDLEDVASEGFLWYYAAHAELPMLPQPLSLPALTEAMMSSNCNGSLIFLRGYPSARWLASLGGLYQIEPSFWKRHLDYLSVEDGTFTPGTPLPSAENHIFHLSSWSIGTWGRFSRPYQRIEHLRSSATDEMRRYRRDLANGQSWRPADSVVRRYTLHDKEHFSIEQTVTVLFHTKDNDSKWIGESGVFHAPILAAKLLSHSLSGLWGRPSNEPWWALDRSQGVLEDAIGADI